MARTMRSAANPIKETFYISHGSPRLAIDDTLPARQFLLSFQDQILPEMPRSILVISAHWEATEPTVSNPHGSYDTIYDIHSNFPDQMYKLKYPAPGAPELANKVKKLLEGAGFNKVHEDEERGLDHGAWVPLILMYPKNDIPVCQLSVQTQMDATYHYNMGRALAPLKEEGVLIICSGSATHNQWTIDKTIPKEGVPQWAVEFDNWLKDSILSARYEDIKKYEEKAPFAKLAHPHPEHFYPLLVAIGAAGVNPRSQLLHHSWSHRSLSYASYKFTDDST